ncbi:B-cell lymphoma/leukemia 10 [Conger conger]|uniref:B-cell lymphoma/leukemia 10 n=1 Tax=Conger conger TaxID=82655 RepID=UPI002A599396|nr:B-cell lymphoma/leukemia 10 [Conger conger]
MDTPHLTEDEMAEIKKEVLERLRPYLCDKIIADRHFDYLRSRKVLSREDAEEISCRTTHRKRTGKLLDYLAENPRGLDTLVESIQLSRSANFIITKITDEVQRVKNERIQALKAGVSCSGYLPPKCSGATNDLSRSLSDESNFEKVAYDSTLQFHPESEWNPSCSEAGSSSTTTLPSQSSSTSTLPKPGDPGAPPLPQEQSDGGGASGGGGAFQPLRSRSMNPPPLHSTPYSST